MDVISVSFNASLIRAGTEKLVCPEETFVAGYAIDSWETWRVVCLSILYVEDVKDVCIIRFMLTGFLLFGVVGFLIHRKLQKLLSALLLMERMVRAVNARTEMIRELSHRQDEISRLRYEVEVKLEKLSARLG